MANVYRERIDVKVKSNFKPKFVQYDHARLEIELLDGGLPYDLSTATRVEFTHVRKDGAVIIHPGEIAPINGRHVLCYDYQGTEMDKLGVVQASFAVFDAENRKVSSHKFEVIVEKDLREDSFSPAQPNYGLIQALIDDVKYVKENGGSGGVGPQGEPGYTPIKGVDYFDGKDGKDGYSPTKGVDYFDGLDGRDGRDGIDGKDGAKGESFTYADFTQSQLEALRGPRGVTGATGPAGSTANIDAHVIDNAPHRYGGKFEWRYNATSGSLDLVVLP